MEKAQPIEFVSSTYKSELDLMLFAHKLLNFLSDLSSNILHSNRLHKS